MKKFLKTTAIIVVFCLAFPLTYGAGYLIGTMQNNKNAEIAYTPPVETLNIMTLNVCSWNFDGKDLETRVKGIADTIKANKPDSIGFQEATPFWMEALNKELGEEYAYTGIGSNTAVDYTNSTDASDEFTAIFYLKDKFQVADKGFFWLSETPDTPSFGWGSAYIRICTWVILENKYTGTRYVHINAHFDNESSEARRNSIGMILNKAKEFDDLPVVFTGDLNFLEISRGYKDITADVLKDTKLLAKETMNSQTYHGADPNAYKDYVLDYVLINQNFKALRYEVIKKKYNNRYISDHYPIITKMEVAC